MTLNWMHVVTALGGESTWRDSFGRSFLSGNLDDAQWRDVLGWAIIDRIMQTTTIEPLMIRVSAKPVAYPGTYVQTRVDGGDIIHRDWRYGAMTEYLRAGATLIANRADRLHPGPARLREEFEYFADDPAWVNSYSCWTKESAFGRHSDDHATVIFQAEGSKHWRIWRGSGPDAPLIVDQRMEAGDVWHVPQGWDHEATGIGPSLHWTFGFHRSTASDLARTALDAWCNRGNIDDGPGGTEDVDEMLSALMSDVPRARSIRSAQSLERRGGLSLPWSVGGGSYTDTRLRWAARFPPLTSVKDGAICIESLGIRLRVDERLEPWVSEWSAGRATLRDDTAAISLEDEGIDAALDALVGAGVLLVEHDRPFAA